MFVSQTPLFVFIMFWIYCKINFVLSITALFVDTKEADAVFALNMTIAVINLLTGILTFGFYIEEKKKRRDAEPYDETSSILSNKSVPSYHSVDPSTDPKDSP
jgi:hypothetical protein